MSNSPRKKDKLLSFDPFADLDGDLVRDVLGPQPIPASSAPVVPETPVEASQQPPNLLPDPIVEYPRHFEEPQDELPEETPDLLGSLLSNLDEIEPDAQLSSAEEEVFEAPLLGDDDFVDGKLAQELFEMVLLSEPESEPSAAIVEPAAEQIAVPQETQLPSPDSEQASLEEIIHQIDAQVYQPERSGDVFGLTSGASPDAATLQRYVVFNVGGTEYAVPILTVSEVVRPLKITPVPNVPEWVLGVANLRGDIISVVDLRVFFGQPAPENLPSNRMLVVHSPNEDITTGLIVDRASGIYDIPLDQIRSPSAQVDDKVTPFLHGVSEVNDRLLVVLELNQLLMSSEMQQFQ